MRQKMRLRIIVAHFCRYLKSIIDFYESLFVMIFSNHIEKNFKDKNFELINRIQNRHENRMTISNKNKFRNVKQ